MKQVLVVGAARSGSAVAHLLVQEGFEVTLTDMKEVENKAEMHELGIKVYDGGHPDLLKEVNWDFIVKNPGIPYHAPFIKYFVDKQTPIYTEVEVASWYAPDFVYAAVTGTNGKTTITSILYELLKYRGKALVAGNIGTPLSELALKYRDEAHDVAIELSNFQLLGCYRFRPHISVVCNLSPDHLDYMKSVDAYYASKMRIYHNCQKDDIFLRNVDDEAVMQYAQNITCRIIDFSLTRNDVDLYYEDGKVYYQDKVLFETSILKIVGMHNVSNAMVAACMALEMGVSEEDIRVGLSQFKSVEHRLEYITEVHDVKFFNDSKATNPEAVVPALKSFDAHIRLLAGGYDKQLSFDILKQFDERVDCCYAFGAVAQQFKNIFSKVIICKDMQEALDRAIKDAKKGDTILLSPACASYDQFKSYEQRGEIFKEYVSAYAKQEGVE